MSEVQRWNVEAEIRREWIDGQDRMDVMLAPMGRRMMRAAALSRGERVLDVGCGTGSTTLAAWDAVGPSGHVTGVDLSRPMIERAMTRAWDSGARIEFIEADAETCLLPPDADVVISRFAVGHFVDSAAGF